MFEKVVALHTHVSVTRASRVCTVLRPTTLEWVGGCVCGGGGGEEVCVCGCVGESVGGGGGGGADGVYSKRV